MTRPNLFTLDTWGRHENLVLEVFRRALVRLESETELPEDEKELNRKLYFRAKARESSPDTSQKTRGAGNHPRQPQPAD